MEIQCDVVVIGAGAAGLTAGIYLRRSNLKAVVLEKSAPGGILLNIHRIDNYPGLPRIAGPDLAVNMMQQALDLGVEIAYEEVAKVEKEEGRFVVYASNVYRAKAIIVASGMTQNEKKVPGEKEFLGKGVSYCASCDGAFFRGQDVMVVGHSDRVAEEAIYLSGLARKVYVAMPEAPSFSERHADILKGLSQVELIPSATLVAVSGTDKVSEAVLSVNGQETRVPVSAVFPLTEGRSAVSFLYPLHPGEEKGFLLVDGNLSTSVPGVFACGDVVKKTLRQVANAVGEAALAATNAIRYVRMLGK